MRVLYFHQHFSTPQGAAGIRSYQMAQKLIESGHEVTMVCGSYGQSKTGLTHEFTDGVRRGVYKGINIIEFALDYSNDMAFIARAKVFLKYALQSSKLIFTEKYDVLFATSTPLTAAVPGIIAKLFRRKPFVFEVRDLWPELPKAMGVITNPFILALMKVLEWSAYKSSDQCIALSPGIRRGILKHKPKEDSVTLIPNGCDLEIFQCRDDVWQPEGIEGSDFVAVFTGTHGIANGLHNVLKAAKVLKNREIKNIKLVLIGHGKLKAQLVSNAKELQLDNIIFLEPVEKAKLAQLMSRADCGLQTLENIPAFYYGTSPNKFFDYLSAGLPVVNNYPGWVADLITEFECGIAIRPDDPDAFADALISLRDNENIDKMASNAIRLAKNKFDRNQLAREFVTVLEKMDKK